MLREWGVLRGSERSLWLAIWVWGPLAFAYFGVQGVLLNLYLLRLGFGLGFIGLLLASGQAVWALAALPAGAAGKRFGLRPVLVAASLLLAVGMTLFLLVEALPRPLWAGGLVVCWMLLWVGAALFAVNSTPYMMQIASDGERNHAFSAVGAFTVLFGFVGSVAAGFLPGVCAGVFGGTLDQAGPYRCALGVTPPLYALAALLWWAVRPVTIRDDDEPAGTRAATPLALFVLLGVIAFLQSAGEGAVRAFFNVYLDAGLSVPVAQIGTLLGAGQLLAIFAVVAMPRLFGKWGTARTMVWASAGAGLALLPVAGVAHVAAAGAGYIGMMALVTINATGRSVFSQEIVPPRWRTTTSAIATIGLAAGWAASAAAGGYLIGVVGYGWWFALSAGLLLLSAAILLIYQRRRE